MIVSLRPFARSRCLRVMGALAWLMLVSTSLLAAPMSMSGHHVSSVQGVVLATSYHCPPDGTTTDAVPAHVASADCCTGHNAMSGCHCATMCANLAPFTLPLIAEVPLSVVYDMPSRVTAPSPNTAPPLRPPSI
jgi:hypothetical protein